MIVIAATTSELPQPHTEFLLNNGSDEYQIDSEGVEFCYSVDGSLDNFTIEDSFQCVRLCCQNCEGFRVDGKFNVMCNQFLYLYLYIAVSQYVFYVY